MAQEIFKRYEKKYILTKEQYKRFVEETSERLTVDQYGKHTICNIYFDTKNYSLIRSSIEKPVYKEKLRLRSYGVPDMDSTVFLEIKKKYDGVVYKRRISLSYNEAMNYLEKGVPPDNKSQIFKEIDWLLNFYKAKPKVFIAYDRIAMYGVKDEELRITFDTAIRSRFEDLDLAMGDSGRLLLPKDNYLMEIKAAGAMPLWLARTLSELRIMPVSFSKYGNVYKRKMTGAAPQELSENRINSAV